VQVKYAQSFELLVFGYIRPDHLCWIDHPVKLFFGDEAKASGSGL